ncbi:MAG: hypothetical protein SH817_00145 [Leptospira sp.]|nr:hypothetical protein [Leptospira sp.]
MKSFITFIIFFLIGGNALWSQGLDSSTYSRLKGVILQTGHQQIEDLRTQVDQITSDPAPYLKVISGESGIRIYAKERAILLLQFYPTEETETFLQQKIGDDAAPKSLRNFAVRSYANGFYWRNQSKVEGFLKEFRSESTLRSTVDRSLEDVKSKGPGKSFQKPKLEDLQKQKKDR